MLSSLHTDVDRMLRNFSKSFQERRMDSALIQCSSASFSGFSGGGRLVVTSDAIKNTGMTQTEKLFYRYP